MEGRRRVEETDRGMRTKPLRLEEKEDRRTAAARRIHTIEEGEDAQRTATFWEECGQFRYGVFQLGGGAEREKGGEARMVIKQF
ncbi:hypothetical protein NDU88_003609 [Pleurodeles waltl]|uniref:Uncharacterized protein n=1 Tax=Pleurodeles waltl TaxID=8319 RepID=A0AAV7M5K4_PLEWA|nr:hypothetical protein NDU88_003609 [Pleurodeles waltl]